MNVLRSFTFWLITISLLCPIFAMQLNSYLRGRLKPQIDAVAGTAWFIFLVLAFVFLGWKIGLTFIIGSFILGALVQPLVATLARRMLGYRTGIDDRQRSAALDRMMAGKISMFDYMDQAHEENRRLRQKLQRLAFRGDIARVLGDNALSMDDYVEHYEYLRLCGLSDLAWEIVGDPDDLSLLIDMKRDGKSPLEVSCAFRDYAT